MHRDIQVISPVEHIYIVRRDLFFRIVRSHVPRHHLPARAADVRPDDETVPHAKLNVEAVLLLLIEACPDIVAHLYAPPAFSPREKDEDARDCGKKDDQDQEKCHGPHRCADRRMRNRTAAILELKYSDSDSEESMAAAACDALE